jgi:hypothetical protein
MGGHPQGIEESGMAWQAIAILWGVSMAAFHKSFFLCTTIVGHYQILYNILTFPPDHYDANEIEGKLAVPD